MAAGTALVGILALVGVLVLTGLVLYYVAKWIRSWKKSEAPSWPPENYMKEIGARCPNYWVYVGQEPGANGQMRDICQNVYDVPVARSTQCYDWDLANKKASFPAIVDWDKYRDSSIGNSERCDWIRNCGPPSEVAGECGPAPTCGPPSGVRHPAGPAAWIGISEHC